MFANRLFNGLGAGSHVTITRALGGRSVRRRFRGAAALSLAVWVLPGASAVRAQEAPEPTEVTVLVVYTDGARAAAGGTQEMTDAIDLKVAAANTALTDSGVQARFRLAHAVEVNYDQHPQHILGDLDRLTKTYDGHLDWIHELRNRYRADLVSLLVTNPQGGAGGGAWRMERRHVDSESLGFSVSAVGTAATTFAHELGHNMGLAHDRSVSDLSRTFVRPYAFGYVNKEAFKAGAPASARWRTIMAYGNRCSAAGFGCPQLARFSNPDQSHLGDALGVPASSTETGADGPADARKTLNDTRDVVASFRRSCTSGFTLATSVRYVPLTGGTTWLDVGAARGCVWEATVGANSDFLTIASGRYMSGAGKVEVRVPANAAERTGTVTVAGLTATIRQVANVPGICARTPQVVHELVRKVPGVTDCANVTASHLASIRQLYFYKALIPALKKGDFDGLTGVRLADLRHNKLTAFPAGLFADMGSLTELYIWDNPLTTLGANVFAGAGNLQLLSVSANQLASLHEDAFAGNPRLRRLHASRNRLTTLPADVFDGLTELRLVNLSGNRLTALPADVFDGLPYLDTLRLDFGSLSELPDGLFSGLSRLRSLWLHGNPGSPFALELELTSSSPAQAPSEASRDIAVDLPLGAPFPMRVELEVDGGTLAADAADLGRGATRSPPVRLTHASNDPALVSITAAPRVPPDWCRLEVATNNFQHRLCYSEVTTRAGPPLAVCSASRCPADLSFGAAAWKAAGGGSVTVTATLSETFDRNVTVPVEVTSSIPGASRFSVTGDSLTFAAGENVAAITVSAAASGDDAETLTLGFGNLPWLVKRAHPTATATVSIDDAAAARSISPTVRIGSDAPFPATGPFTVTFTFNESVLGFAASDIEVANGAGSNFQGSGAAYSLTVTPDAGFAGAVTVRLPAAAARNAAGNGNAAQAASFAADTRAPTVVGLAVVSDPGTDRTYGAGDRIRVAATLSHKAKVTGAPHLSLTVGGNVRPAVYRGSAGTTSLAFEYTVAAGEQDADGVSVAAGRIALNGGAITNEAGGAFDLSHAALPAQAGHRVDGVAPTVRLTTAATLPVNRPFTMDIVFSEEVSGLTLAAIGVVDCLKSNLRGSGAVYSLEVTPLYGVEGSVTVRVPAGAARDRVGNGNAAQSASFTADLVGPSFSSAQADGSSLTLAFDESLDESSTPWSGLFTVQVGGAARRVTAVSVSGKEVTLTVAPAVEHVDSAIAVSYVAPLTSPIRDLAGNAALGISRAAVANVTAWPMTDPSITSGESFTVAENETAVTRLAWSDAETVDDVATWSIAGGADESLFGLDSATGDLSFLAAPDHERPLDAASASPASGAGDNEYVVTVEVSTGTAARKGTAEKTLTVTVTDAAEPPAAPAAPAVSGATASSLTASWAEPSNTGPPIEGYDLQYRASGAADFEDAGRRGPVLTATLPGLRAETEYEVRVRAVNAEGESDWSPSGRGRTSRAGDGGGPGGGPGGGGGGAPPPDDDQDGGSGGSGSGGSGSGAPSRAAISVSAECADGLCRARAGAPLRFEDASTGAVRMRLWDFGDGRQSRSGSLSHAWTEPGFHEVSLWVSDGSGESTASLTFLVEAAEPAGTCEAGAETRCLGDSRYTVSVNWRTADGGSGPARVVRSGTNDAGLFAFFDPDNWEVLVKVLDGCAVNGHRWVFVASTTDLGYAIRIADTATGEAREYRNEPGARAPAVTDVTAFEEGCAP